MAGADDAYMDEAMALVEAVQAVENDRKGLGKDSFATRLLHDFPVVEAFANTGVAQLKEIIKFVNKRKSVEEDYCKALTKLHTSMCKTSVFVDISDAESQEPMHHWRRFGTNLVWASIKEEVASTAHERDTFADSLQVCVIAPMQQRLRELETRWKELIGRGREMISELHEAFRLLTKARTVYDDSRHELHEAETQAQLLRNNHKAKAKDIAKARGKADQCSERVALLEQELSARRQAAKEVQEDFHYKRMPTLLHTFQNYETGRCGNIKKIYLEYGRICVERLNAAAKTRDALMDGMSSVRAEAEVEQCIQQHGTKPVRRSVMSLLRPAKAGRMFMQKRNRDASYDGKLTQHFFVLMKEERKLYLFEREDSLEPREIFDVEPGLSIQPAHASLMSADDFLHSLLLVLPMQKTTVILCPSNEVEATDWLVNIRAVHAGATSEALRTLATLKIEVSEAKPQSKGEFHCLVGLDGEGMARTKTSESGPQPFWGESFEFDGLPGDVAAITIQLRKGAKDAKLKGTVQVPTALFDEKETIVDWFPAYNDAGEQYGTVRCKITFIKHIIRPMWQYRAMVEVTSSRGFLHTLGLVLQPGLREPAAINLLRVQAHRGTVVEFVKALCTLEINSTDNPNIIFRGNSLTTKTLDQYMKMVGMGFLKTTLGGCIAAVYADKRSCELDPCVVTEEKQRETNAKHLQEITHDFWGAVTFSANDLPKSLRAVFEHIQWLVVNRFGDDGVIRYTSVSGFLFLRFIVPAILSPKLFFIMEDHPKELPARTLKLVAKVLQNLGNLVEFGAKEPFMTCMNSFIIDNKETLKSYIDSLSDSSSRVNLSTPESPSAPNAKDKKKRRFFNKGRGSISAGNLNSSQEMDDKGEEPEYKLLDPAANAAAVHKILMDHTEALKENGTPNAMVIFQALDALEQPCSEYVEPTIDYTGVVTPPPVPLEGEEENSTVGETLSALPLGPPPTVVLADPPSPKTPTSPKPEIPTSTKQKPEVPTASKPKPEVPTSTKPKPEVPTASKPKPEVPTASKPKPEVPTASKPKPEVPTASKPKPEVPTSTKPKPEVPTASKPSTDKKALPSAPPPTPPTAPKPPTPAEDASLPREPEHATPAATKPMPPEPAQAPPPPPPDADEDARDDAAEVPVTALKATMLYDYVGRSVDEITAYYGDEVVVVNAEVPGELGWALVRVGDSEGLVPANYLSS